MRAELVRAVADQGYTQPTPIQAQAIPIVLAGRDLLAAAQTGTGKTAGFTLPMLQRFSATATASTSPARHPVRALVLVPTRELAAQVQESVRTYGKHLRLRSTVIFGGVGFHPQADELRRGVDIVVATPGRLLDHIEQRTIDLRHVEILVLDEADRMLDMGFIPAIRRILALLPRERQNLLFSATFPEEIRKLAGSFMRNPATVEVAPRNRPVERIAQTVYPVDRDRKREVLAQLVKAGDWQQVLVFTRTKHGANRLAQQLERDGLEADAIHGNKSQSARTRALRRFKDGELRVLVATDIAARGLDIEELPHVVNYDLPHVAEDYVHRIGRTGRAGATGEAVSLVSADDRPLLAAIERLIGRRIEQRTIDGRTLAAAQAESPAGVENRARPQRVTQPRRDNGSGGNRHAGEPSRSPRGGRGEARRSEGDRRRLEHRPGSGGAPAGRSEDGRRRRRGGGQRSAPAHRDYGGADRQQPRVAAYGQYAGTSVQGSPSAPAQPQSRDDAKQAGRETGRRQILPSIFGLFSRRKFG